MYKAKITADGTQAEHIPEKSFQWDGTLSVHFDYPDWFLTSIGKNIIWFSKYGTPDVKMIIKKPEYLHYAIPGDYISYSTIDDTIVVRDAEKEPAVRHYSKPAKPVKPQRKNNSRRGGLPRISY